MFTDVTRASIVTTFRLVDGQQKPATISGLSDFADRTMQRRYCRNFIFMVSEDRQPEVVGLELLNLSQGIELRI